MHEGPRRLAPRTDTEPEYVKSPSLHLVPGLVLTAALSACSTPQMTAPADVVNASELLPISERSRWSGALVDESFRMGPYQVVEVDREWRRGRGWSILGLSSDRITSGYSFGLGGDGPVTKGVCASESSGKSLDLGSGRSVSQRAARLSCACGDDSTVLLQTTSDGTYGGLLQTSEGSYQIKAIYDRQGTWSDGNPSGYRVDGDVAVGAVDVLRPGRVWVVRAIEPGERKQLACIFAGLMLYQPPSD